MFYHHGMMWFRDMEAIGMLNSDSAAKKAQDLSGARELKMKEIHKPSAFEGALWTALGMKDARVIYHAPPGC